MKHRTNRPSADEDCDWPVQFGATGCLHTLTDYAPTKRNGRPKTIKRHPVGFHIPRKA